MLERARGGKMIDRDAVTEDEHMESLLGMFKVMSLQGQSAFLQRAAEQLTEEQAFAVLPTMLARVSNWSHVPHDVFEALMKARVAVALELVLIARDPDGGDAWVYLTRRPDDDPHYAGLLHVPGSILRPNEDLRDVAHRLRNAEFGFPLPEAVRFVDLNMNHDTRGSCLGLIYLGDVGELPDDRTNWHRVRDLDLQQLCVHHGMPRGIVDKAHSYWSEHIGGDYLLLAL